MYQVAKRDLNNASLCIVGIMNLTAVYLVQTDQAAVQGASEVSQGQPGEFEGAGARYRQPSWVCISTQRTNHCNRVGDAKCCKFCWCQTACQAQNSAFACIQAEPWSTQSSYNLEGARSINPRQVSWLAVLTLT